jgi:oxygen-independent coproporphyrinogen-3 oxidase
MNAMWPYYPELLATPVPRYTSYPTAAEFEPDIGNEQFLAQLQKVQGDVSLYVHIPFCEKICWYCGCNTGVANHHKRLESYLDALHREIALVAARLPSWARVRHIAFGGGSPNAIAPVDFVRLLAALTVHFRPADPVVSIELDPRTLTETWAEVIAAVGIARASLGVQTTVPRLQQAIGRVQPATEIRRAVEMLRAAGVESLNFDLMYGLPGQTMDDLAETLGFAVEQKADRIALFGYAHVPHLIPRQRKIDATGLPGPQDRFAMAARGYEMLAGAGYQAVGFDHFALPGDPMAKAALSGKLHRNFQGFTDDAAPVLIGLGASAISSFPELLVQNEKNSGRYRMLLSQDHFTASRGIARGAEDRAIGAIIEGLLCHGRAPVGGRLMQETAERLMPFAERQLVRFEHGHLVITSDGLPYARSIAAQFDKYRASSEQKFSSAV